jgi:hypothetical protein
MWLDEWGLNPECLIGRRFLQLGVGVILAEDLHDLGRGRGREVRTVPRVNALTFALQQSKMTENVGGSSCEMLGTNRAAILIGFLSPSSTGLLTSSRFRLRPQAPLAGPW